jgi:hypothetical protein
MQTYPVLKQAPRHEDVLESEGIAPHILTSALDGGERSASHPDYFTPEEVAWGASWTGGWVGPRAGMEAMTNGKESPYRNSNPRSSSPWHNHCADWAIPAPTIYKF